MTANNSFKSPCPPMPKGGEGGILQGGTKQGRFLRRIFSLSKRPHTLFQNLKPLPCIIYSRHIRDNANASLPLPSTNEIATPSATARDDEHKVARQNGSYAKVSQQAGFCQVFRVSIAVMMPDKSKFASSDIILQYKNKPVMFFGKTPESRKNGPVHQAAAGELFFPHFHVPWGHGIAPPCKACPRGFQAGSRAGGIRVMTANNSFKSPPPPFAKGGRGGDFARGDETKALFVTGLFHSRHIRDSANVSLPLPSTNEIAAPPSVPLDPMGLTRMANARHRGQSGSGQLPPATSGRLAMTDRNMPRMLNMGLTQRSRSILTNPSQIAL
ncbi:MAG: hypothetical protein HZA02_07445 [Nitrospinae bacterium]|nr:hypothetical protein [Nitrospinota bacterium]